MSAFPAIAPTYASTIDEESDRSVDRATDGSPIVREFYSGKERVVVVFEGLTAAERATIKAHRAAHSLLAFDFDWDGTILSCVYGPSALKWKPEKPDRWGLRMGLVVV